MLPAVSEIFYEFEDVDTFTAGAVGRPGERTFFLQAREGRRVVSVVMEKVQVAVLADRLGQLIAEIERCVRLTPPSDARAR